MFQQLKGTRYELSQNAANFLAGGLASNLYWLTALPSDNVKSRIMGDSLVKPKYRGIWHVVKTILHEKDLTSRSRLGNTTAGLKNFYRVRP
jgi:solute carrier family 25 carnitine/acylcarnitine transporter 20/29